MRARSGSKRSGRTLAALALAAAAGWACGRDAPDPAVAPEAPPAHGPVATSSAGMVVTGSVYATEAGRRMLARGGNAVDAAVAAAFALAVAEPTQSGLGGRTQMILRLADGSIHGIDGTTEVPAGYDPDGAPEGEHGHAAVAIPGTVAALVRAAEAYGSLPLATLVEPAASWARGGVVLTPGEADRLAGLADELEPSSEAARLFTAGGGRALPAGAPLVQPALADVLDRIAEGGHDAFYRGEVARAMAEDMAAHGGFVTAEDLAAYRAEEAAWGRARYRGHEVVGSYLPASGVTVGQILQIIDRLGLPEDEVGRAAVLAEALVAGFEDRETAERTLEPGPAVAWLTSDSLADRRADDVRLRLATHAVEVGRRAPARLYGAFDRDVEPAFTTHVSVADTLGNVVALTQSLGPTGGARVVTPGLGFLYASTLGGYLTGGGPGYRPWSSQAPLLVLRDGRPVLVMGGAGARRILSALVGTLTRVVDDGMPLDEALGAPRLHPTGGTILVEEGWPAAAALEAAGYRVEERERSYFARLNVVALRSDGTFLGVGDPRWSGSAAAGPER